MASTFFGLTIAYSGLQAANTSLTITGHNVSNINTKGYTKQQAGTQAADALRTHTTYGAIVRCCCYRNKSDTRQLL